MTRARRREMIGRYQWPILAGVAITAFVLGMVGYGRMLSVPSVGPAAVHYSIVDRLYDTVALFRYSTSLSDDERDKDRNPVRDIPALLAQAGFEVVRLPAR